jgi:hypothetical protein
MFKGGPAPVDLPNAGFRIIDCVVVGSISEAGVCLTQRVKTSCPGVIHGPLTHIPSVALDIIE